ncbi:dienelactone hydrolase [Rhodanobacter sp. TND4EL1]
MNAAPTEDACWAAHDRIEAAFAGSDVDEQLAAIVHAWDTWLAAGIISIDDIRTPMLPHLRDAFAVLIEHDPELAEAQVEIACERMDAERYGLAEAGWAGLVLHSFTYARQDLGLDLVLTPEFKASLARLARGIETRADLACIVLHRHAMQSFSAAQADAAEAWSTSKGARREAQDILELLGEPVDTREGWYLQRRLSQGGGE